MPVIHISTVSLPQAKKYLRCFFRVKIVPVIHISTLPTAGEKNNKLQLYKFLELNFSEKKTRKKKTTKSCQKMLIITTVFFNNKKNTSQGFWSEREKQTWDQNKILLFYVGSCCLLLFEAKQRVHVFSASGEKKA